MTTHELVMIRDYLIFLQRVINHDDKVGYTKGTLEKIINETIAPELNKINIKIEKEINNV